MRTTTTTHNQSTEHGDTPETVPISTALLAEHANILQQLVEHIATLPACEVCDSCSDVKFLSAYADQALQTFRAAMDDQPHLLDSAGEKAYNGSNADNRSGWEGCPIIATR